MIIDTIAANSKVGSPKWNGVMRANQPASPTPDQSTMPGTKRAAIVPTTRPSSTETRWSAGGPNRSMRTITMRVPTA